MASSDGRIIENLPDGNTKLTWPNGRWQIRNEMGQVVSAHLPPEVAREMSGGAAKIRDDVDKLIIEAGFDTEDVPAWIRLMAQQAIKSHLAMVHWRRLTRTDNKDDASLQAEELPVGSLCPMCGQIVGGLPKEFWDIVSRRGNLYAGSDGPDLLESEIVTV